jgi:hypothetical protein
MYRSLPESSEVFTEASTRSQRILVLPELCLEPLAHQVNLVLAIYALQFAQPASLPDTSGQVG